MHNAKFFQESLFVYCGLIRTASPAASRVNEQDSCRPIVILGAGVGFLLDLS